MCCSPGHFQSKTPYIRPLSDQIDDPPGLILKYLEDNLLQASKSKTLTRSEIKYVAREILEALNVLHGAGFVHTGIVAQSRVYLQLLM